MYFDLNDLTQSIHLFLPFTSRKAPHNEASKVGLVQFALVDPFNGTWTSLLMAGKTAVDNCRICLCTWALIERLHVLSKRCGKCSVSRNQHATIRWHQFRQIKRREGRLFPTAIFTMCGEQIDHFAVQCSHRKSQFRGLVRLNWSKLSSLIPFVSTKRKTKTHQSNHPR